MLPIIYIHFGKIPQYLINSINQAKIYNEEVILLSDENYKDDKIKCFPVCEYDAGIDLFEKAYKHMSTNSPEFEIICFKRWFVLRNFMNQKGINNCYYSDSDAMIYDDLSKVYENYKNYDAVYTSSELENNYCWAASACCSYWKKDTINSFVEFILQTYSSETNVLKDKWEYHLNNNIEGGVCDMTLLYLFSKEINFYSLSKVNNDICFDNNIFISENYHKNEYEMERNFVNKFELKKIKWKNSFPYGYNKIYNKEVRFVVLTEYAKLMELNNSLIKYFGGRIKSKIKRVLN